MIKLTQPEHGLTAFFEQFGLLCHTEPVNNRIEIPASMGSGYIQLETLPNNLTALITDYKLNEDFFYERSSSPVELYTLRTREVQIEEQMITEIGDENVKQAKGFHKSIFLTASFFELHQFFSAHTQNTAVFVEFNSEWLGRYFKMDTYDDVLREYLSLKAKLLHAVMMDADYSKAHHDILHLNRNHPAERVILHNRIMYIIERFFNDLYERRREIKFRIKANKKDIDTVMETERRIMSDLSRFASIVSLSRQAGMSPSKLKSLFRKIYGLPMHEYFQQQRMIKAKALILNEQFSVKQAAIETGFKNFSNFSAAFKKQFGIAPNELLPKKAFE
jgi:AraC-like DNA-binding protein